MTAVQKQPHRYFWLRLLSQSISFTILFLVPVTGFIRVDFWSGNHRLFFEPVSLNVGLAGVIVGIVAMYVVTFLSNVAAGRMFCGWGCPVAQISRCGEQVAISKKRGQRILHATWGALLSAIFILGMTAWWIDLRVLIYGSLPAAGIVWAILLAGAMWGYLHGRVIRWSFCIKVCPIGMYYSVVSPAKYYGIHFRNEEQSCIECDACDNVCPVDLKPRELMALMTEPRGLSIADAPGRNHCIECGDCVRACEFMIEKSKEEIVPLRLGWYEGPQRVELPKEDRLLDKNSKT